MPPKDNTHTSTPPHDSFPDRLRSSSTIFSSSHAQNLPILSEQSLRFFLRPHPLCLRLQLIPPFLLSSYVGFCFGIRFLVLFLVEVPGDRPLLRFLRVEHIVSLLVILVTILILIPVLWIRL